MLFAKGDIYKKKYKGLYCVGDEAFMKDSDLVNGRCPNHPTMELIEIEEENYFFKLSAYQEKLLAYLRQDGVIVPEWRRLEAIQFVERGLEDFSISRVKEKMPWGVAVPDDEKQVMYVWFDALTNYISTLGWPEGGEFKKYWEDGEVLQMAGKDQVRFQSIMWQAMLMSADIKNTDKVVYHGFITSGGQKMSKSIGNVIDPYAIVEEYGADALRFFLARHIHPFEDSDFTMERFKEAYNADLANGIGNLASRILTLSEKNLAHPVETHMPSAYIKKFTECIDAGEISKAVEHIWGKVSTIDSFITSERPFSVVKSDPEKGKEMIRQCVEELWVIARHLEPIMPRTSLAIQGAIRENKKPENLFPRKE
jgi:methionyl-tRNA synthetase